MHHVAILNKSLNFLTKIIDGTKTIESRWYLKRSAPWGNIDSGDTVYFKNSGELVSISAEVEKVLEFENLDAEQAKVILQRYYQEIGLSVQDIETFYQKIKNKKYCILIFLKNTQKITPFNINKKGFGTMSAWICIDDIKKLII